LSHALFSPIVTAKMSQNGHETLSHMSQNAGFLGGNITQIVDASWVNGASRNETRTYGYDFLNRLLVADVKVTTTQNIVEERDYAYNPIGNMTSFTQDNGTPTTYTYPSGSQPITQPHAVSSRDIPNTSNDDSFEYDANGNMTQRVQEGVTYCQTFDAENRLVTVETLSSGNCSSKTVSTTVSYVYGGAGNRVKRIVGNTTTLYVAGMEIEKVSGTETQRTVYYPAGGAFRVIGGSNAGLYYRHSDHLGSTSVLSDSTGAKVTGSDVVYAPFGEVRSGTESALTDFGYTGQRHDDDTGGLMYYGARYYLPELRRFISADSIVPGMFNPQALNRYTYSINNPINFIDPTGHVYQPDSYLEYEMLEFQQAGGTVDEDIQTGIEQGTFASVQPEMPVSSEGDDECTTRGCIEPDTSYQPGLDTSWNVTLMAWTILSSPNANALEKTGAYAWMAWNASADALLVIGSLGLAVAAYEAAGFACFASPACITLVTGGGGAAAKVASDTTCGGDCSDELSGGGGPTQVIQGFTRHGLNQLISNDEHGVNNKALLDAVQNPLQIFQQSGGRVGYEGVDATVILNSVGKVITTWANTHLGWRY